MAVCHIWIESGEVIIRAPYNPRFSETLKDEIPRQSRWWDGEDKVWKATEEYYEEVIAIAQEFFEQVVTSKNVGGGKKREKGTRFDDDGTDWKSAALSAQREVTRLQELLRRSNAGPSSAPGGDSRLGRLSPFLLDPDVLKSLRRVLASKFHPDVAKDNGEKMKTINTILDEMEGK